MASSQQPNILVAVSGGIAAYKTVDVVSRLRKSGAEVYVAMSEAAANFVAPLTFSAVSGHRVLDHLWPDRPGEDLEDLYPHLYPATGADAFVLAPATANMIARLAQGLGDDLVSTCALSLPPHCRKVFCPSMNVEMWANETTQEHAASLRDRGWVQIGPDEGFLACGMVGAGRMSDPEAIAEQVLESLAHRDLLQGKTVLILSGPTREHIDPVRFLSNASSGRMGRALAEAALALGAEVHFVTGPVEPAQLPRGTKLVVHPVTSASDMLEAAEKVFPQADVTVFAAAVADYAPRQRQSGKGPKPTGPTTLDLHPTPDIAATLSSRKRPDQVTLGFALQTSDGLEPARGKLETKNLDGIVLNYLEALGREQGAFTFLERDHAEPDDWGPLSKRACAHRLLTSAAQKLPS